MTTANEIRVVSVDKSPDGKEHGSPYYPIIDYQVSSLVGKVLTQLELMPLNEMQLKAAKSLFQEIVYGWFESVKENSRTAAPDTIQPFWVVRKVTGEKGEGSFKRIHAE